MRGLVEDNVDEGCYVRHINFAIGADIGKLKISGFAVENHIHQGCHVGHIHLSIKVDAPISEVTLDIGETLPLARRPVCTQILVQHMQCYIFGHVIENVPPGADFFRIGIGINPRQAAATAERLVAD